MSTTKSKIKFLSLLTFFLVALFMIPVTVNAATRSINATKKNLNVGKKFTLKVTGAATSDKISFTTSDKKIATVSAKGVVKGISTGKATISVTVTDKKNKSYKFKCVVTVKAVAVGDINDWKLVTEYSSSSASEYKFNSKGLPVKRTTSINAYETYKYDKNNNLVKTEYYSKNSDSEYDLDRYITYKYNNNNVLIKQETYSSDYSDKTIFNLDSGYTYDDKGNTLEGVYGKNSVWRDSKYTYTYYENGAKKTETYYKLDKSTGDYKQSSYTEYSKNGYITYKAVNSDAGENIMDYEPEYDQNGNMIKIQYRDNFNNTLLGYMAFEYDKNGNVTHQIPYDLYGEKVLWLEQNERASEIINTYKIINGESKLSSNITYYKVYAEKDYYTKITTDYNYDKKGILISTTKHVCHIDAVTGAEAKANDCVYYFEPWESTTNNIPDKYDKYGNVVEKTDSWGRTTTYSYSPASFPKGKVGDIFTRTVVKDNWTAGSTTQIFICIK